MKHSHEFYAQQALNLAVKSAKNGTGPFGCVIVKNNKIIATGVNQVTKFNDPTAHSEIQAIRKACKKLKNFQLTGCSIYSSGFPCPLCFGALYWARPKAIYYVNTLEQAAKIGFDDVYIYKEFRKSNANRQYKLKRIKLPNQLEAFNIWEKDKNKKTY